VRDLLNFLRIVLLIWLWEFRDRYCNLLGTICYHPGHPFVVPLLFQTKMDRWTNPVIVVWVNLEVQRWPFLCYPMHNSRCITCAEESTMIIAFHVKTDVTLLLKSTEPVWLQTCGNVMSTNIETEGHFCFILKCDAQWLFRSECVWIYQIHVIYCVCGSIKFMSSIEFLFAVVEYNRSSVRLQF
jgi:hypothetical protein